ncbi:hypothetical protein TcBrA4_0051710 [Trypanosoma cruzi]|nr:hypothetical protein TcBrA4_0051710 [Trypanosoma cruzi]
MGGAMQRKLDDAEAEPLLQQCRKMASDMEALRRSEQRYRALVGDDDAGDRCADREDPSTRAQCLHGIESALAALGVEESEEPAAAAIMRAAEEARAREEELHDRLDESAARGRALESKLSELTRTADSLQRALDGGVLAVGDEEDASAAGDRAVEALKRLCEDSVTVSAVMGGAMQRKLDDAEAEPLLQQCRKMASDMEALRRSEQRYRALVGDDDAGDRCADREDPSTRAQCLHGIESALAALGVEESEEPAAAAIMRAAEEARAREEELHDRLDESAARGRALESKLSELTRTADSLQRALDGGVLAVGDEEDASAAGDRAVEALKRLCEDSVTVSAVMGGAMQRKLDDAEAEPLLQQCRKMASDMEALRRSEQRYRALVGDDDAGDRCADREDPSTRAQCLHGIESALAALGVEESEEPAAAAIMRAAEEARAREEELHDRLDESAARGRALESKLSELTRTADSLQRALDGGVLAVGDEEDASAAGDRAVEALKRLCEDSVTVSAVMGGAMQRKLDDAEAEPLLQQCRKMASDMEALRRSEQRYRALVGDDDAGDRCADREDPSTRAQCLHGIESALAALGVEESEEPAAAAIMRAAEEARAREEELHDRLDESAARGRALESKLSELTRTADSLQRALDGGVLAVGDEEDASAAGDRAVEALKRLCEDSVTVSAVMGGAMQRKLDDAEAEPLLQQCRKMASDMEALRRSEQRYRALVGDDDAGDRCADREDPSTRAQCLHGIESALAALGVEESEEPAQRPS